jgi:hypothetical protein
MNLFSKYRKINKDELREIQKLNDIVGAEKLKLILIQGNTLLINDGQKVKEQQEAVVKLLEQKVSEYMGQLLSNLGYPAQTKATMNLKNGEITVVNDTTQHTNN